MYKYLGLGSIVFPEIPYILVKFHVIFNMYIGEFQKLLQKYITENVNISFFFYLRLGGGGVVAFGMIFQQLVH